MVRRLVWVALVFWFWCLSACASTSNDTPRTETPTSPSPPSPPPAPPSTPPTYDIDALGVPQFASHDYIDLDSIGRISLFRSSAGHDYHDDREACRSMKNYFEPKSSVDWSTVGIFSPVDGAISATQPDFVGTQLAITPTANPAFTIIIFHVSPSIATAVGTPLLAGQAIGTHVSNVTMSDVTVGVRSPSGYRLVSWFEIMTDAVWQHYAARGLSSRTSAMISRPDRDADPLTCSGETFTSFGTLPSWVSLF